MPGGKRRLRQLFTSALKVGTASEGTWIKDIMGGSVTVTTPVFTGTTTGSIASTNATITGLTASHTLLATVNSGCAQSGCIVFAGACAMLNSANFYWAYIAACGGPAVAAGTVTMRYLAFKT